jgi:putative ABC transport system ATP-binding protein
LLARWEDFSVIRIQALRYAWPGQAHDTLALPDMQAPAGATVFVHGPSGCGKSTLLGLLAGVLVPREGRVQLMDQDWSRLSAAQRDTFRADHVGVIFQQFNLLPYLTVMDNVTLPCRFSTLRRARCLKGPERAAQDWLARMGLSEALWSRRADTLSVGQQQRVAAARALMGQPDVVLADEPTSALDAALRDEFMALLLQACREAGSTLVCVSHDAHQASRFDLQWAMPALMSNATAEAS